MENETGRIPISPEVVERVARAIAKERGIDPDMAIVTYEAKGGILLPRYWRMEL